MNRFRNRVLWSLSIVLLTVGCATKAPEKKEDLVWPLPPEQPRVRFVRAYCCLDDFGKTGREAWLDTIFGTSQSAGMSKPYAITTDKEGKVYVSDTGLRTVWVFDEKSKKVSFVGQGALRTPTGLAVDAKGRLFVSDSSAQKVYAFDKDGKMLLAIGKKDELGNPAGLAIDVATNRLYVANAKPHQI